jgi:putative ABC transport system permease protein
MWNWLSGTFRQLARDLRARKVRTLLTTLGIVWGTTSVSLLRAFGTGLHKQLLKNAAGIGSGIVIAWPSQTSIPFEGLGKGRRIRLSQDDIDLVKKRAQGLGEISLEYQETLRLRIGPRTLPVQVSGVNPPYGEMRNLIPQAGGRFINPIDERLKRRVAFVGNELAETLFGAGDPVGQTFRLHGSPFTVVGVLQRKVQQSSYSGRDKDKLVIPAATFRALTGEEYLDNLIFTAADVSRTEQVTSEVLAAIAGKHRFDPTDEEALMSWDTAQGAKFLDTFMLAFNLFLGIIGVLTLVVGGIGVSNIMNVVVEERTPEIGVKMALGARPRAVLGQFLLETLIVTAVGGIIGLSITAAICGVFPALGQGAIDFVGVPEVSATVAGTTAALLGLIGLIAGFFPARAAAALDPVVAMKMQ